MEDLIQRISSGNTNVLFLSGFSGDVASMRIVSQIKQIQRMCSRVHAILFKTHKSNSRMDETIDKAEIENFDSTSDYGDRMHFIDLNLSSESSILVECLKWCRLIYMMDMYFSVESSSGELSPTTKVILNYLSLCQAEAPIFCLHSVSVLFKNQDRTGNEKNGMKSRQLSNRSIEERNKGMSNLTSGFQDISIIHMVGDPQQVLKLMKWSISTLRYYSHDIMQLKQPAIELSPLVKSNEPSSSSVQELSDSFSLYSISEVFYPLFATGLLQDSGHNPYSTTSPNSVGNAFCGYDESSIADTMLTMSSPERQTRAGFNKRMHDFDVDTDGNNLTSLTSGKALKRSHTLSAVGELSQSLFTGQSTSGGTHSTSENLMSSQGKALRRTVSEGKASSTHPPRPPIMSTIVHNSSNNSHGRSFLLDDGYSNESAGSYDWTSWRADQDKDSIISLPYSQTSCNASPTQQSGGYFKHIFSQEERDKLHNRETSSTRASDTPLSLPPQVMSSSHPLGLLPGSPSTPLFLLNDNSNHSQISLPPVVAFTENGCVDSHPLSSNGSALKAGDSRDISRKISFLSATQEKEVEECYGDTDNSPFSFMNGL